MICPQRSNSCISVLKCVRFGFVARIECVFFVWAILWAQSEQCVPPRWLKCTLRTTGGFNPQLELPFLLYLTYNELFSLSFCLFLSVSVPLHNPADGVSDQNPGKLCRRRPLAVSVSSSGQIEFGSLFQFCGTFVSAAWLCHPIRGFERRVIAEGELSLGLPTN